MSKRKDFPEWVVKEVYIRQDGVCARCGNSLEKGFHRHHKDGNPANNDPENLELLCPECHYCTFKKKELEEHRELERDIMYTLHDALHKVAEKELSGAALERMILAASRILSISRHEKGLDDPMERLPGLHAEVAVNNLEEWMKGFKEGFRRGIELIKSFTQGQSDPQ